MHHHNQPSHAIGHGNRPKQKLRRELIERWPLILVPYAEFRRSYIHTLISSCASDFTVYVRFLVPPQAPTYYLKTTDTHPPKKKAEPWPQKCQPTQQYCFSTRTKKNELPLYNTCTLARPFDTAAGTSAITTTNNSVQAPTRHCCGQRAQTHEYNGPKHTQKKTDDIWPTAGGYTR